MAIATLFIHLPAVPQNSVRIATTAVADLDSSVVFTPASTVPESASPAAVLPTSWSLPLSVPTAFVAPVYPAPTKRPERAKPSRGLWLTLTIAQHGAATFDAWSTRRVISMGWGQEGNPLLRPFASNTSLYAAIQVSPLILDYLGGRMMKRRQGWIRRAWWLPQALGTVSSVAAGVHNMGVANVPH